MKLYLADVDAAISISGQPRERANRTQVLNAVTENIMHSNLKLSSKAAVTRTKEVIKFALGFCMTKDIVLHHIDYSEKHNEFSNIRFMTRSAHSYIHTVSVYLDIVHMLTKGKAVFIPISSLEAFETECKVYSAFFRTCTTKGRISDICRICSLHSELFDEVLPEICTDMYRRLSDRYLPKTKISEAIPSNSELPILREEDSDLKPYFDKIFDFIADIKEAVDAVVITKEDVESTLVESHEERIKLSKETKADEKAGKVDISSVDPDLLEDGKHYLRLILKKYSKDSKYRRGLESILKVLGSISID